MDQILSQLIPTQRVGSDGFNWWVGQIEETAANEKNNKGGYRFKVRIVGDHPKSKEILPTKDLPWANVMMPVNVPFMPGNVGGAHPQLIKHCWVVGFYLDNDKQKPIIMGSIGQTPGATTKSLSERPESTESFQTYNNTTGASVNPASDGKPAPENPQGGEGEANKTTGALPDGTVNGEGEPRVPPVPRKEEGIKDEKWCQTVAEKCDDQDFSTKATHILGEFLYEIQRNGGNIGTYLVGQVNGRINDGVGIARKYVNKFMKIVRKFIAKVKGFIIEKMTNAVKDLIRALLKPSKTGNILTPVTEWFNNLLKDLGCKMADLGERLEKWLTNVLMSYVNQIYRAVACQIDALVNGILSKINSLMEDVLGSILGPLQSILGAIATPLNIIGGAINFVLKLLGISCSGPDQTCAKYKVICTDGDKKKKKDDKDFLDNLLSDIDNLFPATGADYTQYTCAEAYTGRPLEITTVGFTGGIPRTVNAGTSRRQIVYTIDDIIVEEGNEAVFTVTRTGDTEIASSVKYKTIVGEGTATKDVDYLSQEGILGFAAGETTKTINIRTFYNAEVEDQEEFFVKMTRNSPDSNSDVPTQFIKNIGKCTIIEVDLKEPSNPYPIKETNPISGVDETFPPGETDVPPIDTGDGDGGDGTDGGTGTGDGDTTTAVSTYKVSADKSSVREGEFVVYTITTTNVEGGTILYYTLSGDGIFPQDILGGELTGSTTVSNNQAKVTVGIAEDGTIEDDEILTFSVNGTGASVDVLITVPDQTLDDLDEGVGESPETVYSEFEPPTIDEDNIITDENGGIIEIPVSVPGSPWAEPPYVFIGGEGIGATATALLDGDGFLTEIRIKSAGYGYKKNLASDKGVRCIIDTFTVLKPGIDYSSTPEIYINGELGVAEAIINDDGFLIGARVLDRTRTYEEFPEIVVVGGGGYGAKLLPSLVCLDNNALSKVGATKIGTGRYVDCP